jgi:small subunit ribosomal protein S21
VVLWNIQESNTRQCRFGKGLKSVEVKVFGDNIEKALRIFKRQLQKEGLFRDVKRRERFEKPSEKRKRKRREARRTRLKAARSTR